METNFKIKENIYYNEYGEEERKNYYIIEKYNILLGKILDTEYWKKVVHPSFDSYDVTTFNTLEEATNFVKNVLCKNKPRCTWKSKVVSEISCNN